MTSAHPLQKLQVLLHEADDGTVILIAGLLPLALGLQQVKKLDLAELTLRARVRPESLAKAFV